MSIRFPIIGFILLSVISSGIRNVNAADYQLQTLERAHHLFRSATNSAMHAEAAQQFEFLVKEEGTRNGHLYYTLGNCWFLAGDIGRAILNYRRAEQLLPHDEDLLHNLKNALEMRTDLIPARERHPLMEKLLGWHFNTAPAFRWWTFTVCWLIFWCATAVARRTPKKEVRITSVIAGALSLVLFASLLTELVSKRGREPGVILANEVLARKGDGDRYAPSFLEPLHAGTEFQRLDDRGTWWHIELADGQSCWIPAQSADTVSLLGK